MDKTTGAEQLNEIIAAYERLATESDVKADVVVGRAPLFG